jgi:hypothetical protein
MFILCSTPEVRVVVFPFLECIIAGSPFNTCTPPPGSGSGMVAGTGTRSDLFGVSKDAENCLFSYHRKYHFIWDSTTTFTELDPILTCFTDLFSLACLPHAETLYPKESKNPSGLDSDAR